MVFLRRILPEDQERILDILTSEYVNKTYMLPDFEQREDAYALYLKLKNLSQEEDQYVRAIDLEGRLVGFLNQVEVSGNSIELGYVIHPEFHGKGYMTKGLKLAMEELFTMGYTEVITSAFSTNLASIRVMEKCGMNPMDKTDEIVYRGITHTCVYYRKTQE